MWAKNAWYSCRQNVWNAGLFQCHLLAAAISNKLDTIKITLTMHILFGMGRNTMGSSALAACYVGEITWWLVNGVVLLLPHTHCHGCFVTTTTHWNKHGTLGCLVNGYLILEQLGSVMFRMECMTTYCLCPSPICRHQVWPYMVTITFELTIWNIINLVHEICGCKLLA